MAVPPNDRTNRYLHYLGGMLIFAAAFIAFGRTLGYGFIYLDDDYYFKLPLITQFNLTTLGEFFRFWYGNWTPLTWLSHNLIYQIFGPNLLWHHLANVVLHGLNSVLVALLTRDVLARFTTTTDSHMADPDGPSRWAAFTIGLFYAVHPQHVETVTWLAARKDLLSTLFALFACRYYLRHLETRSLRVTVVLAVLFALSLMAKPVLVTLPLALIVFDGLWAWHSGTPLATYLSPANGMRLDRPWSKLPLLGISLAFGLLAYFGQDDAGALSHLDYNLFVRSCFVVANIDHYLAQYLLLGNFLPMYPIPPASAVSPYPLLATVVGAVLLYLALPRRVVIGLGAALLAYVVLLLPVSGIMFVGLHATADRFAYAPMIPVFVVTGLALRWTYARVEFGENKRRWLTAAVVALVLGIALLRSLLYAAAWRSSSELWNYALIRNPHDVPAMMYLGAALVRNGEGKLAIPILERAASESQNKHVVYGEENLFYTYIKALVQAGRRGDAVRILREVRSKPGQTPKEIEKIDRYLELLKSQ